MNKGVVSVEEINEVANKRDNLLKEIDNAYRGMR